MFERFTEKAIRAIMLAQKEARRLGHNYVGSEQMLLGLIGEGTGITGRSLKGCGLNLKEARVEVEKIIGYGSGFVADEIPFTVGSKRILELSWSEARQLGNNHIGTEHLLLGILRENDGVAIDVLTILGIDRIKLRRLIISALGAEPPEPSTSPKAPEDQNKFGLHIDKDLMQILRLIRLAEQKAKVLRLAELSETLERYEVEISNEFSRLGFNLQEEAPPPAPPSEVIHLAGIENRPGVTGDVGLERISSIRKFFFEDLEKIGKIINSDLSDTPRWLPKEAATELQSLLQRVGSQPGVIGSVIVGNDGLLIANTLPPALDAEQIGVWALAIYMNTQNAAKKLGHDRVYQIASKTPRGDIVIADFGSGLLVTVSGARDILDDKVFEGLTHKATKTIMHALDEARRFEYNFIDTEHILLGLIDEGTGIGAKSLWKMGVNLEDARMEVEKIVKRGSGFVADDMPLTARAKRVLELSWDEARLLGHNYVGTEHLLLGLLREQEGVASRVLEHLGVDHTRLRSYVLRLLGESGAETRE